MGRVIVMENERNPFSPNYSPPPENEHGTGTLLLTDRTYVGEGEGWTSQNAALYGGLWS